HRALAAYTPRARGRGWSGARRCSAGRPARAGQRQRQRQRRRTLPPALTPGGLTAASASLAAGALTFFGALYAARSPFVARVLLLAGGWRRGALAVLLYAASYLVGGGELRGARVIVTGRATFALPPGILRTDRRIGARPL